MSIASEKLNLLRGQLFRSDPPSGALLVVYPPEEELSFRDGYEEFIQELQARENKVIVLDFRTLVFNALQARNLLKKVLMLDAQDNPDTRKSLVSMVQKETEARILQAAEESPDAILVCKQTASLFPWVSFSEVLKAVEGEIQNTLVIPFPGTESGPSLHFLAAKNGYDYRATRI